MAQCLFALPALAQASYLSVILDLDGGLCRYKKRHRLAAVTASERRRRLGKEEGQQNLKLPVAAEKTVGRQVRLLRVVQDNGSGTQDSVA